jgi:hypothetical protein
MAKSHQKTMIMDTKTPMDLPKEFAPEFAANQNSEQHLRNPRARQEPKAVQLNSGKA